MRELSEVAIQKLVSHDVSVDPDSIPPRFVSDFLQASQSFEKPVSKHSRCVILMVRLCRLGCLIGETGVVKKNLPPVSSIFSLGAFIALL
jgi:hypothetical protein